MRPGTRIGIPCTSSAPLSALRNSRGIRGKIQLHGRRPKRGTGEAKSGISTALIPSPAERRALQSIPLGTRPVGSYFIAQVTLHITLASLASVQGSGCMSRLWRLAHPAEGEAPGQAIRSVLVPGAGDMEGKAGLEDPGARALVRARADPHLQTGLGRGGHNGRRCYRGRCRCAKKGVGSPPEKGLRGGPLPLSEVRREDGRDRGDTGSCGDQGRHRLSCGKGERATSIGEVQFTILAPCRGKARLWFSSHAQNGVVDGQTFRE
jgi:hypothetical protein